MEDRVTDIRATERTCSGVHEVTLDKDGLLRSYKEYEEEYNKLLADYLHPEADINKLIHEVIADATSLKPIDCVNGWGPNVKVKVPKILAGIFAIFTVSKSGASFHRINIASADSGSKILMKPHCIQVLTLLCMFGCGDPSGLSLDNQVMQIRTGEGKSLIIGAAAVVLGLFGFQVRCVCYSEYLSNRDYDLFQDLFAHFQLTDEIKHSKITTLSEESTLEKGDIRKMTESLIQGQLQHGLNCAGEPAPSQSITVTGKEEIMLVDELDVFFGPGFYGKTYNQVAQLRDPEVAEILRFIWNSSKAAAGRKQKLIDVQSTNAYISLLNKYRNYPFLLDNEITHMLHQVTKVDDVPYYLDKSTDRIGYKMMDTIEYGVTYGYSTMFAYLKEADLGILSDAA